LESNKSKPQSQEFSLVNGTYLNRTGHGVQVFENCVAFYDETRKPKLLPVNRFKRGLVKTFSDNSRLRLQRLLAKVNFSNYADIYFMTLTYHQVRERPASYYIRDLKVFLQFMKRNYGARDYVWRLEFQKRGVPHFHVFIFSDGVNYKLRQPVHVRSLKRAWSDLVEPGDRAHRIFGLSVKLVTGYRQASFYLSKYTAKEADVELTDFSARRWGYSRGQLVCPVADVQLSAPVWKAVRKKVAKFIADKPSHNLYYADIVGGNADTCVYISAQELYVLLASLSALSGTDQLTISFIKQKLKGRHL
jgi:hypothetical protein